MIREYFRDSTLCSLDRVIRSACARERPRGWASRAQALTAWPLGDHSRRPPPPPLALAATRRVSET